MDKEILVSPSRVHNDGALGDPLGSIVWNQAMRHALLYWPKVALPRFVDNVWRNRKDVYDRSEIEYLTQVGQIRFVDFVTEASDGWPNETFRRGTDEYLKGALGLRRGVLFSKAPSGHEAENFITNFFGSDIERSTSRISIEVELTNLLPMPPQTATVVDIIEYKQKHADLFRTLHEELDKQSFLFGQAGEFAEGLRLARREIEPVLADLDAYTLGRWPKRVLGSLRQHIGDFAHNAIGGAFIGSFLNEPVVGAVASAGRGMLQAIVVSAMKRKPHTERTLPFAYCYHQGSL